MPWPLGASSRATVRARTGRSDPSASCGGSSTTSRTGVPGGVHGARASASASWRLREDAEGAITSRNE
eukprot:1299739-Prymnesium_polylepis.1